VRSTLLAGLVFASASVLVAVPRSYHPRSSKPHVPSGQESHSKTHVHGYTRKDGTYVAPHDRSKPNHSKRDNWSTKGNVNPETGKPGEKPPAE
jgi:hypothetical protein